MEFFEFVARYVVPPILGGIGAFVTPWAKWYLEERKERNAARRKRVQQWRAMVHEISTQEYGEQHRQNANFVVRKDGKITSQEFARRLLTHREFSSLRPHLSDALVEKLRELDSNKAIQIELGTSATTFLRVQVEEEIARIEKHWKLL